MALLETLQADLKQAMLAQDVKTLGTLRLLTAALKNREIELRVKQQTVDDAEVIATLQREVKKRRESAKLYTDGGRPELAEQELEEVKILEKYLPAQLSEDELRALIAEVQQATGASGAGAFGQVMKETMARAAGRTDGNTVSRLVKEILG